MMHYKNGEIFPDQSLQITENIYWVGHYLPNDPFQCHVYLIKNGKDSILIDPGSMLTFNYTLRKIEEIIPFSHIRYFICHHQDPDITGALPLIDKMVARDDAVIISHWRAIALLKHYGFKIPMICIEEEDWKMTIGSREFSFIFTPYLHFPGAFCTFDKKTGILFSSDLFGGFTEGFSLFAESEDYFNDLRAFHEHYMPSNEILVNGLSKLESLPLKLIAPQHGSIIPERLIPFMINQLKNLDCGLYLMTQTSTHVKKLLNLNNILNRFLKTIIFHRNFNEIAQAFQSQIQEIIPVNKIQYYTLNLEGEIFLLSPETMYRGHKTALPPNLKKLIGTRMKDWVAENGQSYIKMSCDKTDKGCYNLILPLHSPEVEKITNLAVLTVGNDVSIDGETEKVLEKIAMPLSVAIERELIQQALDTEKQKFYEQAIRDPLTGLYTRIYMREAVKRILLMHDRNIYNGVAMIIFDIDLFKKVNDTFGHTAGDIVLRSVAGVILETTREGDIQIRLGGEEFVVVIVEDIKGKAQILAERIRSNIEKLKFPVPMENHRITISGGIAFHKKEEELNSLLQRADKALYEAKETGRNRIILSAEE